MSQSVSKNGEKGFLNKLQILGFSCTEYKRDSKKLQGYLRGQDNKQVAIATNTFVSTCKYKTATNQWYMNLSQRRSSRVVRDNLQKRETAWSRCLNELQEPSSRKKKTILKLFSEPKESPNQYMVWHDNYLHEFGEEMTKFCDAFEQWIDILAFDMSVTLESSPRSYMYYNMNSLSELNNALKAKQNSTTTNSVETYANARQYRTSTKARGSTIVDVEQSEDVTNRKRKLARLSTEWESTSAKKRRKEEKPHSDNYIPKLQPSSRKIKHQSKQSRMGIDRKAVPYDKLSLFLSKTLDGIGYSYNMIKNRQYMFRNNDKIVSRFKKQLDVRITTGGKGEGTAMYFENDTDYMFVYKEAICAEKPEQFKSIKHIHLFQTDCHKSPPGYTKLKLVKLAGRRYRDEIRASLYEEIDGSYNVSSSVFLESIDKVQEVYENRDGLKRTASSGPSTPLSDKYDSFDNVMSFPCYCPDVLDEWVTRTRSHGWPEADKIHEISAMDGHVVPVGYKGSTKQFMEWRICYSLAELHLMQSLNKCQIQMYVVIKDIAKSCLKPICKDMTSYIMKNITLWVCETNHISKFNIEFLLDRILDAFRLLMNCIVRNNLPSYMISERNLLAGRLQPNQRKQLENVLGDLLSEKSCILLRSNKLRQSMLVMYKVPSTLENYGKRRDQLERIVLLRNWIREFAWEPDMARADRNRKAGEHVAYKILERQMDVLLQCDDETLRTQGVSFSEINDIWMEKMKLVLS